MSFKDRKRERIEHYKNCIEGWKLRPCSACSGSGYYDSFGSPNCGACDGTGKERYKPDLKNSDMGVN
jgi:DnaJ-class molecular chaperone